MADTPKTRFAKLGEDRIAYQVLGEGPSDLLLAPSSGSCIDLFWDWPAFASFLRRLASFSRLIIFDRRGYGASDAVSTEALPTWEWWTDDALAVLDAVGSERATLLGIADAGPIAILFAASQPERTQALILASTSARFRVDEDYPWGQTEAEIQVAVEALEELWGTEALAEFGYPEASRDPAFREWVAKMTRLTCPPRAASTYFHWVQFTDVRDVLRLIQVPTLVLHRERVAYMTVEHGRYLADHISGARLVIIPGADGGLGTEPLAEAISQIEQFMSRAPTTASDRALAAVLFTDIVGSTERAANLGDRQWRNLLESHDAVARTLIDQHRGRLVKTTGDGVLATFDGPGRAIGCAFALRDALLALGIDIRAGLHAGEVELRGQDIGGIGVHIASRVLDQAGAGELVVSGAVPLLVAGSGIEFEDRGEQELKGVPGTWKLFAVRG